MTQTINNNIVKNIRCIREHYLLRIVRTLGTDRRVAAATERTHTCSFVCVDKFNDCLSQLLVCLPPAVILPTSVLISA